jgi:ubiquinone/menaquinone biosynthesis C-methylase UbiE
LSVFDKRAKQWDGKSRRVQLAADVVKGIIERGQIRQGASVTDFGTGTGLILLGLSEIAGKMTGLDSSKEMLSVLEEKAKEAGIENLETRVFDIDTDEFEPESTEYVVASMVTHHLEHPEMFLEKAFRGLVKGGKICFADLIEEDGSFHDSPDIHVKHHGFSLEWVEQNLRKAGFSNIHAAPVTEVVKEKDGEEKAFPVFLAVAEKI